MIQYSKRIIIGLSKASYGVDTGCSAFAEHDGTRIIAVGMTLHESIVAW
jgi:hypothetical protein